MTDETIKAAYKANIRFFERTFEASKKVYDAGYGALASSLYRQADNHRKYMRRAVMPAAWLNSRGL